MRSRIFLLVLAVVGCASKKAAAPAPTTTIELAGKQVSYRDWRGQDACKADAMTHWSQLEAWNAALGDFLKQTNMGADGIWTEEQVKMLEKATAELGPALDGLDSQVSGTAKCPYPKTSGVADSAKTSEELSQQARKLLADAPTLLPALKEKLEINKWKAAQAEAIKTGRESWCGGKVKPGTVPEIFYAAADETGKTEWIFCDDVKVSAAQGAKPEVHVDEGKKKPHNAKQYVDAALKYPASEVQHPPKPGEKPTAEGEKTETKPEG